MSQSAPNIIMFLVDDLGFTDTGYYSNYEAGANNFAFSTPVLENMASAGVRLNYHYSESVCAATRSALLSGRYAWRTGSDYMVMYFSTLQTNYCLFEEIRFTLTLLDVSHRSLPDRPSTQTPT